MADSTELVCLSVVICLQKVTVRSSQTQSVGTRPQSSASTRFPELSRIPSQASTYAPPVPQFRSVWAPLPPPLPPPPTSSTSTSTQPTISRKRTIAEIEAEDDALEKEIDRQIDHMMAQRKKLKTKRRSLQ